MPKKLKLWKGFRKWLKVYRIIHIKSERLSYPYHNKDVIYRLRSYFTNFRIKAMMEVFPISFLKRNIEHVMLPQIPFLMYVKMNLQQLSAVWFLLWIWGKIHHFFMFWRGGAGNRNLSDAKKGKGINKFMKT